MNLEEAIKCEEPTVEMLIEHFPAERIGPTWQRGDDGKFLLPDRTLGWHIIAWISENLTSFTGEGRLALTGEQCRFILWFYALDEDNVFKYRAATLQRLKGWGKDPLSAVLCIVELIGPCRYSHDAEDGTPVGQPHPNAWVGLGAVSLEQTRNTRALFSKIIPERTQKRYGMKITSEIIIANKGKSRLHAYGANAAAVEGVRFTFFLMNETQHWTKSNRLEDVYLTVRGNVAKDPLIGHYLCITNAFNPGQGSVAEKIRMTQEEIWRGVKEDDATLYDSLEAHPSVPLNSRWAPLVIDQIKGDATWLTWQGVRSEVMAGDMLPSRKRRMWYNQIVTTEEAAFTPTELNNAVPDGLLGTRADLQPNDEIVLGFDGGRTDDSTALVALRLRDKLLIPIAVWQKPDNVDSWTIDATRVDSVVHQAFRLYDVKAFYADVNLWESYINSWADNYRERLVIKASAHSPIAFDMRGNGRRISDNNEQFLQSIRDGTLFFNGSKTLRAHMLNAEARFDNVGLKFAKAGGRESGRKIDALIAATLAFMAYRDLQEKKQKTEKKTYRSQLLRA